MASGIVSEVVEAFEINDSANDVYQHNFKHRPYQMLGFFLLLVNLILDKAFRNTLVMLGLFRFSGFLSLYRIQQSLHKCYL
jgi:hypothetical protein